MKTAVMPLIKRQNAPTIPQNGISPASVLMAPSGPKAETMLPMGWITVLGRKERRTKNELVFST